ncbi:MAG: hypothetical protein NG740_03620 [Omnitrophica bacterium]|nr:hypothetical protein [Candidatus Omnitrophota bacterium]
MKVILFAKEGKPTVKDVVEFLKTHFSETLVYLGNPGDNLPEKVFNEKCDILISYLSPWIIPRTILDISKFANINFHPGPPKYPGIGCFNFAIYNEEKTYGVTAHLMEEKVDTGNIIAVKRFSLPENDSVYKLCRRSYAHMLLLFYNVMDFILRNNVLPASREVWKRKPYLREELNMLCLVKPGMPHREIEKRVKATTYPGMPGAYLKLSGHRFEYSPKRR